MATGGPCDDLSILCVTKAEACVRSPLLGLIQDAYDLGASIVVSVDGLDAINRLSEMCLPGGVDDIGQRPRFTLHCVSSKGYVESVLDEAIAATSRPFILRIDDDEQISPAMLRWLERGEYREADHWQFPRQQMWKCPSQRTGCLMTPHLYPDFQTRLSVRSMAGGRSGVHAPSPHGGGEIAPVALWHWKYVVRTREDRLRIAQTYDSYSPGYGTGNMLPFSLPEEAYDEMRVVEAGDGSVPWTPRWEETVINARS